jgi:hypothetical protein
MRIVELILNEDEDNAGIDAVSVVENPAIESDFVALKKHQVELKTVNDEKRLLMGAALIPDKQIYRKNGEDEYYIYFSKDTIRKASQLFLKKSNQNNATIEHQRKIDGMSVVESWVKESEQDKSTMYGFNHPNGTWYITMKVENDEVWKEVKKGNIKGFSIEGYFAEKIEASKQQLKSVVIDDNLAIIDDRNAYNTIEKALKVAKDVGCSGYHSHNFEGRTWYMPCAKHVENSEIPTIDLKKPCTSGYEMIGYKTKKGKKVPNCVPIKNSTELESYADYPKAVSNNAKRGVELNKKNNNKCGTLVGKNRGADLAAGRPVEVKTIQRMYSYLSRAKTYYDDADTNDCGNISYLLWGGLAGLKWSKSKLKELGKLEATNEQINKETLEKIKKLFRKKQG